MKEKVLIISFSNLKRDPRVYRQIRALKDLYSVFVVGYGDPHVEGVCSIPVVEYKRNLIELFKFVIRLKLRMFERAYWEKSLVDLRNKLMKDKFDVVIANEINSLPLALSIAQGAKVICDAHEYSPREFEDIFLWRFFLQEYRQYLCKQYLKQCDKMTTVCSSIAQEYNKNFGIQPSVITNARPKTNHEVSFVQEKLIRIVHHGIAHPSRRIEKMIELMQHLDDRFSLDLFLVPVQNNLRYFEKLKKISQNKRNVNFLDSVTSEKLIDVLNQYDIGIFVIEGINFNYKYTLPNKLFDFIQARLAIVIGPSPEMAKIVDKYDCGIVVEDFSVEKTSMQIKSLTAERVTYYKRQSDKAAQVLTSENGEQELRNLIEKC